MSAWVLFWDACDGVSERGARFSPLPPGKGNFVINLSVFGVMDGIFRGTHYVLRRIVSSGVGRGPFKVVYCVRILFAVAVDDDPTVC